MKDKKMDSKKKGKMCALQDLHKMASDMMGDDMGEVRKVSVMAKDKEGIKKGLEKAKELLNKKK